MNSHEIHLYKISCLNTSLMKNIAVVILLRILIRGKDDLWNFLLPHFLSVCACVCFFLYMIRSLYDLIKFYIENTWLDSNSLFWKKNLKETVNKRIWLTGDLLSLKILRLPAQCISYARKIHFALLQVEKNVLWSSSKKCPAFHSFWCEVPSLLGIHCNCFLSHITSSCCTPNTSFWGYCLDKMHWVFVSWLLEDERGEVGRGAL